MRKASSKLFFTKLASVWSVWSQMLPESLSTARWMIQGQKFTVKDKPKGEAHKLSMKCRHKQQNLRIKQVNGVSLELPTKKIQCFDWWRCSKMHAVFYVRDVQNLISWYLKSFDRAGGTKEHLTVRTSYETRKRKNSLPEKFNSMKASW